MGVVLLGTFMVILDTTIVNTDGTTELEVHEPTSDPLIDCFYVYPTVSRDPEANSDLVPAEEDEIYTTVNQAAPSWA